MTSFTQVGRQLLDQVSLHGGLAVFLILAIEEAGVPLPVPGDLILVYAGYKVSQSNLNFFDIFLWSVAGVTLGSSFLYWIFRLGGRAFALKFGKYILLPPDRLNHLEKWVNTRGRWAVLIGRFVPGLRVFVSAGAGFSDLNYGYFLPQIIMASIGWVLLFMGIGFILGERWQSAADAVLGHSWVFAIIFFGSIAALLLKNRRRKNRL